MTEQQFNDNLKQFTGTESYYKHTLGLIFTDGVKWCVDDVCSCYWLLDILGSYQYQLEKEEFQVWQLKKTGESKAIVTCEDGNKNELICQEISFTDFPFSKLTFWCIDRVVMLPTEY